MLGAMTFRKDCEECGRSFLTPDRKAKVCQRCSGKGHLKPQPQVAAPKGTPLNTTEKAPNPPEKGPVSGPAEGPKAQVIEKTETQGGGQEATGAKTKPAPREKAGLAEAPTTPVQKTEAPPLTPARVREIIDRYQKYVEALERPTIGRRKTIAADLGIPYQSVVLALRQWNQQQPQLEDLTREQSFAIEKIYFSHLDGHIFFLEIKTRIVQATGLNPWVVSRYLDHIHDGERKVQNVLPPSPEQETAILEEYRQYLSASGPPEPPLHTLIAERTGVTAKQVYKTLLAYRLSRFREKWAKHQNQ